MPALPAGRRAGKTLQHCMLLLGHELLEAGDAAAAERLLTQVAGVCVRVFGCALILLPVQTGQCKSLSPHWLWGRRWGMLALPLHCWQPIMRRLLPAGALGGPARLGPAVAAGVPPAHTRPGGEWDCNWLWFRRPHLYS